MFYKNKKTGCFWDITDKNILKRVQKDMNFEPYHFDEPEVNNEQPEEKNEQPIESGDDKNGSTNAPKDKTGNKK